MPSPDLREYVDLTLFDKDTQDLIDQALVDADVKLPDWEPREGNTEMVHLEGVALIVSQLIFALNRVPAAVVQIVLRLFNVQRGTGQPPEADLRFALSDAIGHTIPAETVARLTLPGDLEPMDFTTTVDLVIPNGDLEGVVAAVGSRNTTAANAIAGGTMLELQSAVPYVDSVELDTAVTAGADPETVVDYLNRGVQVFATLTTTLVKPEHFTAAALLNPLVFRATTLDNFDVSLGAGAPGDHPGHMSVLVAGVAGAALSGPDQAALEASLEEAARANIAVHVATPDLVDVGVAATVVRRVGAVAAAVEAAVDAAVEAYLDPDAWEWGRDVYVNELISVIDNVAGVDRVVAITLPGGDVGITSRELARAAAVNTTVLDP